MDRLEEEEEAEAEAREKIAKLVDRVFPFLGTCLSKIEDQTSFTLSICFSNAQGAADDVCAPCANGGQTCK